MKVENDELRQLIDILNSKQIITFANGRYSHEIRKCVMDLVSLNVSLNKASDVIRTVLGNMTDIDSDKTRLPSTGARKKFMEEAHLLAQCQVAEAMVEGGLDGTKGNCLHGDGTTKYSRHYENFQVTTKSGKTLSLGLQEVVDSDAESLLNKFCDVIGDISDVMQGDKNKNLSELVASIKNTMSDRASVNPLFQSKLKVYREQLLPNVIQNWDTLNQLEQTQMKEMGNFFCSLHFVNLQK